MLFREEPEDGRVGMRGERGEEKNGLEGCVRFFLPLVRNSSFFFSLLSEIKAFGKDSLTWQWHILNDDQAAKC